MCTANHTYIPYIILCFPTKTYFLHIYANKDINVHTVQNVHRCMYNLLNRIYMLGRFRNCPIWRHNWLDKPKMPKLWKNNVNWDRVYHITKTVSGRSFKSFCRILGHSRLTPSPCCLMIYHKILIVRISLVCHESLYF